MIELRWVKRDNKESVPSFLVATGRYHKLQDLEAEALNESFKVAGGLTQKEIQS